jgi:tripartite-type tricarboxylate transporter receptor subunit TctC
MRNHIASLTVSLCGLLAAFAASGEYPERPIRMIVGYPGGDTTDLVARVVSSTLGEFLKKPVIVENRPGGNGNIAAVRVAKSKADGYTVLLAASSFSTNPSLYPQSALQPLRDFAPVSRVAVVHNVLVVHASHPAKTLAQFVAAVRANPARTSFASGGKGGASHLAAELMKTTVGPLNTLHVPYKGNGLALADLMGGHVDALFAPMPFAFPNVRSGRIRALAVASPKRAVGLPEVPTFHESGVAGFEAVSWNAIVAPAGTPYDAIVRLSLGTTQLASVPVFRERLGALGGEPASDTPDQLAEYLRAEIAKWAKVIKVASITLD